MSHESLQMAILAILAVVLFLQTSALVGVALYIVRVRRPVEALLASTHELLGIARRGVKRLDFTLARIGQMVQERSEQANGVAEELLDKSQKRDQAADQLISHLLRQMEHATDEIGRVFHKPFQEAHAVTAWFRAGFESLF